MVSITDIKVRRVLSGDAHEDQKWLVLEGSLEGFPEVTKRDSISVKSLASGAVVLENRVAKMRDDVWEYYQNVQFLKNIPESL